MSSESGVLDLGDTAPKEKPAEGLSGQERRELMKKMKSLDRKMEKLHEQAAALEAEITEMSSGDNPDFEAIGVKTGQVAELRAQREELEMEWLDLGEQLEN